MEAAAVDFRVIAGYYISMALRLGFCGREHAFLSGRRQRFEQAITIYTIKKHQKGTAGRGHYVDGRTKSREGKVISIINKIVPKALSEVSMKDAVQWSEKRNDYDKVREELLKLFKKLE